MALRNIRKDTDPVLRKKSRPVTEFNERLWTLIDDLRQTLGQAEGIGLAAPQIGVLRRVVVIVDDELGDYELVNPEIIEREGTQTFREACLSLPKRYGVTERPRYVKVRAQDRNGEFHEYEGKDLLARCFCHEIDHLDGVLYPDRLAPGEKLHLEEDA